MFTYDPVTKKTKVDHGFNVYPPSEPSVSDEKVYYSSDDEEGDEE
jgi:hypothetical protein